MAFHVLIRGLGLIDHWKKLLLTFTDDKIIWLSWDHIKKTHQLIYTNIRRIHGFMPKQIPNIGKILLSIVFNCTNDLYFLFKGLDNVYL